MKTLLISKIAALKLTALKLAVVMSAFVWAIPSSTAQDQDKARVVNVIWGFDDRVVEGQFVPVSILLDNLGDAPLEGELILRSDQGLNEIGGTFVQTVFVGGTSRRWVHFYPYISRSMMTWKLTLQTEEEEIEFPEIAQPRRLFDPFNETREGLRMTVVILDPPGQMNRSPTTIKHMPAEVFPPYATATHGLYAVFLDHVPNWDLPRQEAFMSWLRMGGRLHLLLDSNNQQPRFSGVMSVLNDPLPELTIGAGKVTRHEYQRNTLPAQITAQVLAVPSRRSEEDATSARTANQLGIGYIPLPATRADEFLERLRSLTNPAHNWLLLTFFALIYIGLLFPGSYLLSKKQNVPFYAGYLVILGAAIVFSVIFLIFGRRGHGETTAIDSLMIARAETKTHWSVLDLSHLFVTVGDEYRIEEEDRQTLFASGSDTERVAAEITSGNRASYVSQVPPFSGQPLLARRHLSLDSWDLRLLRFSQSSTELVSLDLQVGNNFPSGESVTYHVLHGHHVYTLQLDATKKMLSMVGRAEELVAFCNPQEININSFSIWGTSDPEPVDDEDKRTTVFRKAFPELLGRSLVDDFCENLSTFQLPEGEVRLFVYAPAPQAWKLPLSADSNHRGRVLYVRPIPLITELLPGTYE